MTRSTLLALLALLPACLDWEPQHVGTLENDLPAADLAALHVDTGLGDLEIVGDPDAGGVAVTLEVFCAGPGCADRCDPGQVDLRLEDQGDGTALLVVRFPDQRFDVWVDVTVSLPSSMGLVVRDENGDASVRGVASVELYDGLGDAEISEIAGDVRIDDGSGDLYVAGVTGDVFIVDGLGDLFVAGVGGDLDIDDEGGDIVVEDVAGSVTVRDALGDIVVRGVGSLDVVEDSGGSVTEL